MMDQYVKDIQSWPSPLSRKEISSFLGFTGYYRGFIPSYSALTNRMNSLKKMRQQKRKIKNTRKLTKWEK